MKARLQQIVLILGAAFLVLLVIRSRHELASTLASIYLPIFVLSVLIATGGNFLTGYFFTKLLDKYGAPVGGRLGFRLFFYGQIAKYIPGKVWSIVYQSMLLDRPGTTSAVLLANVDLVAIQILNCALVAVALLLLDAEPGLAAMILLVGLGICVVFVRSCHLFNLLKRIRRFAGRLSGGAGICNADCPANTVIVYCILFWLTYVAGHFFLLSSAFHLEPGQALIYVAFLGLSWIAGVVAMISPAGLGVREGVFILLAQTTHQAVDLEVLAAIAVIARLWLILQELLGVSLVYAWNAYAARRAGAATSDAR